MIALTLSQTEFRALHDALAQYVENNGELDEVENQDELDVMQAGEQLLARVDTMRAASAVDFLPIDSPCPVCHEAELHRDGCSEIG